MPVSLPIEDQYLCTFKELVLKADEGLGEN